MTKNFRLLGLALAFCLSIFASCLPAAAQNYKVGALSIPNYIAANSTNTYSDGGTTNVITLKGFDQVGLEIRFRYHTNGIVATTPVFRFGPSLFANSNACAQASAQIAIAVPTSSGTNWSVIVTNIPRNSIGGVGFLHLKSMENLSPDGVLTNVTIRWSLKTRNSGPENL